MIRMEGMIYCNLTWAQVQAKYPNDQPRYLTNYCFNTAYIVSLLQFSYGFNPVERGNITFMAEVAGVNLDWTLGAMLFEASNIPEVPTPMTSLIHTPGGIVLLILSVALLVTVVGLFLFNWRRASAPDTEKKRLLLGESSY